MIRGNRLIVKLMQMWIYYNINKRPEVAKVSSGFFSCYPMWVRERNAL